MPKIRELLRLKFSADLSLRQIASSLSLSLGVVAKYVKLATAAGLGWPLPEDLTDSQLLTRLQPKKKAVDDSATMLVKPQLPDFIEIQQELKRKGMTLQLLWEEYADCHSTGYYSYSHLALLYRQWQSKQKLSMRQSHRVGEKLFVDYCGPTVEVVNPDTGVSKTAQVFVAVLGASSYTYAEATWTQKLSDWIGAHVRAFEFLGGLPEIVIPDNLKSAVNKACRYDPVLNPAYHEMAEHYDIAVIPARPYKPKDKAKAEAGVQIVERWIMMRLRKHTFFTLASINQTIQDLLKDLNNRPFQKQPGSRFSQFELLDQPALKALPTHAYEYRDIKKARVNIDYHIDYERHYYSVPYQLVKEEVRVCAGERLVTIYHNGKQVALHARSLTQGGHTTDALHRPKSHQKHLEWSPQRFLKWADQVGPNTCHVIKYQLESRRHPEHGYRTCLGILHLSKRYTKPRVEAACARARSIGAMNYRNIKSILKNGLDKTPLKTIEDSKESSLPSAHENVRGKEYYSE